VDGLGQVRLGFVRLGRHIVAPVRADLGVDSGRRQGAEPAAFGSGPRFCSQSGGGAATRMNSRTLMIVDGDSPRRSTMKLIVPGGEIHDLPELGTGDVGVDVLVITSSTASKKG
jgi:hypothetical protein